MKASVHSLETFGTVDGPGVRLVVFLQGCPLRCLYCHNPDTWSQSGGTQYDSDEILALYEKNKAFYRRGGITVTGGEPLLQMDFIIDLFTKAKNRGIHTCIDTSGIVFSPDNKDFLEKFDKLLAVTDLIMLDIKHIDDEEHKKLTGQSNKNILAFARYVDAKGLGLLVRHVIVPNITDVADEQYRLGRFLGTLKNIKALDAIPYHNMGEVKYKNLGIDYPLSGTPQLEPEKAVLARNNILGGMKDIRSGR